MHFITGGAFNGKRKWARSYYGLNEQPFVWHSFYEKDSDPAFSGEMVVLEGLEQYVKTLIERNEEDVRQAWKSTLSEWIEWENQETERQLVLIGTDITKGIVPIEASQRKWRDYTGWCFQDAAAKADRMDVIWYGINQQFK